MRKGELTFNYVVMLGPVVLGLTLVGSIGIVESMPQTAFWLMTALLLTGFSLFAKAKVSVIKQGQLFTFGTSHMSKQNRVLYILGYSAMALGILLILGFTFVVRFAHGRML